MNATELAKTVIDAVKENKADDALAATTAAAFAELEPTAMYHFVVQVAGGLRDTPEHKSGLAAFNLLLTKHQPFVDGMAKLNKAKEAGELQKPA